MIREGNGLLPKVPAQQADPGFLTEALTFLLVQLLSLFNQTPQANLQFWHRASASERHKNVNEDRMWINKQNLGSSTTCAVQAEARPPS